MRIRHHSIFKNLNKNIIDWEQLRNDPSESSYFLPEIKSTYIELCNQNFDKNLICTINKILKVNNINEVFSLGSGRAILEFHLSKSKNITVSDSSSSILKLKKFEIFDNVYHLNLFDALEKIKPKQLVLLGRIDTELDDQELKLLFKKLYNKRNKVIFIPAQKLTLKSFIIEYYIRLKALVFFKKLVFCGYSRTQRRFKKLWGKDFKILNLDRFYYLTLQ